MFDPESFAKTNQCCLETTSAALQKYGHLIRWNSDGQDTAIDGGCGPGNVLAKVLHPLLKDKCSRVYAVDLSDEMLDYCREKYSSLERLIVEFVKMDIGSGLDVQKFLQTPGPVDHVIASFLLHWLLDEEQGLRNIFNLLKPGGDFFSVHFHSCTAFLMHEHVQKSEKWRHFFNDLHLHTPKSTSENHSEAELIDTLSRCGFTDIFVKLSRSTWTLGPPDFVTLLKSAHAQIDNIPKERIEEYMHDYIKLGIQKQLIRLTVSGDYEFDFNTYVAFGRRPRD